MKALSRFVAKFTSLIVAVLSCLDRVIFKSMGSDRVSSLSMGSDRVSSLFPVQGVSPCHHDGK